MPRRPKYRKGKLVRTFEELVHEIDGMRWLYYRDRPKHPFVLASMTYTTLRGALRGGLIYTTQEASDG